jgi:hypothetical protein
MLAPGRVRAQLDELLKQLPPLPGGARGSGTLGDARIGQASRS